MSAGEFSASMSYRQHFAERWKRFIRENFDSPAHAARVFNVDRSTAENWFDGRNAPSGFAVGFAYERMPRAAEMLRGRK